jgi:glycerol dehydrogenase-like iron-containing ADH family enzyme
MGQPEYEYFEPVFPPDSTHETIHNSDGSKSLVVRGMRYIQILGTSISKNLKGKGSVLNEWDGTRWRRRPL